MKPHMFKKLFAISILYIFSNTLSAREYFSYNNNEERCNSTCFDCSCFNFQVQAGVAPIVWTHKGDFTAVSCNASLGCPTSTIGPVLSLFELPKFNHLFKIPWTVGGKIGYLLDDNVEIYVEANYRQARAKNNLLIQTNLDLLLFVAQPQFVFSDLSKYSFVDVYVGARYYFDPCWCECISFFVGGQLGFVHHKEINFRLTTSSLTNPCAPAFTTDRLPLFNKHNGVAAGANIGLDYCICDCLSLVLTAEFIATCRPEGNSNISFDECTADAVLPELRPTNFIIHSSGTELFFPITLGLKYNF